MEFILNTMKTFDETWKDIIFQTLNEEELCQKINLENKFLPPFTIWSEKRIYFPVNCTYHNTNDLNQMSNIESVPRIPCKEKTSLYIDV